MSEPEEVRRDRGERGPISPRYERVLASWLGRRLGPGRRP